MLERWEKMLGQWPLEKGERVVADLFNEGQEMVYMAEVRHRQVEVRKRGWREILASTGMGVYRRDSLECKVLMLSGGRGGSGKMENVRFLVGVWDGGKVGEFEVSDDVVMTFDGDERPGVEAILRRGERLPRGSDSWIKRSERVKVSAFDKLEKVLKELEVVEKTKTEITFRGADEAVGGV